MCCALGADAEEGSREWSSGLAANSVNEPNGVNEPHDDGHEPHDDDGHEPCHGHDVPGGSRVPDPHKALCRLSLLLIVQGVWAPT